MNKIKDKNKIEVFYNDSCPVCKREIEIYKSIQKDDIMRVAKSYLNKNQRIYIDYLPKETE
ncbi:MAG: hypothetical protein CMP39_01550 [Rickettsiales bacterium]|nr:hypothetical protein [Rickettsiales bacterium]